jgi:TonB family protein
MALSMTAHSMGGLRIAFGSAQPPGNKTAWKNAIGGNDATAHFTLLAQPEPRWSAFGASVALQFAWVSLLIAVPMLVPQRLIPIMRYQVISVVTARTEVPLSPKPPMVKPKLKPLPERPIEPPKVAKLVAPPRPLAPKPKPVEAVLPVVVTPVFQGANLNVQKSEPARPREEVKTGMLSTGSAALATVNKPINQVQTGGFGDPNGIPGKGDPHKRANIAQRGSFDLPGGPGYGNGTGGANGVRGTVASAGFGNGVAIPVGGSGNGRGSVKQSGFADASTPAPEAPKARSTASAASATQPVEILFKPDPVYTQEARNLKLEGEVLLQVVFPANGGQVQVVRVARSLGHGLDEAAVRAAQQIRFKPAKRDGQPVDFPAAVHIVFQLAY